MPENQTARVRGEVGLVSRQYRAEIAQILKFPKFGIRLRSIRRDREGERRLAAEQAKKYLVVPVEEGFDLLSLQQFQLQRVAADQAVITPDWNEARLRMGQRFAQPLGILAHFAAAIDESACKHIVVFHLACGFLFSV